MNDGTVPIPTSAEEITCAWLASVFERQGFASRPSDITVAPIGTGQMASSVRVEISATGASDLPASVAVKFASPDPNSLNAGAQGAYLKEVRFYQQFAELLPVATPGCLWADINTESHQFVLVLEDMRPAQQGDQIAGSTVEQALVSARTIAGLHARYWNDERLFDHEWLTAPRAERIESYAQVKAVVSLFTPGFIDRYRNRLTAHQVGLLNWFAENVDSWLEADGGRFGLLHGDHRLDNLLYNPNNSDQPVTVVDWQTIGVRNPVGDVSYLLGTGLDPSDRRSAEHDLVAAYHAELLRFGVSDYSLDQCFDDYRSQTPHALLLTVLGSMMTGQTARGDDMFMAMLTRSSQQMIDLGVY